MVILFYNILIDAEKAKLSEKLVQINFESQNREEELHQLQLKVSASTMIVYDSIIIGILC